MSTTRRVTLGAESVSVLGQGTWGFAEDDRRRAGEIAALRRGLELGLDMVDTAEMYANGRAEEVVAEAVAGHRDEVFVVSKVLPHHATRRGTVQACEGSLRRLGTDRIDLYLLHWPGSVPLAETLAAFEELRSAGKIRHWGVSNFDRSDLAELDTHALGSAVATNQVLYNLTRRGIEYDVLPACQRLDIPVMAYSPIEQGRLLDHADLGDVARRHGVTPAQVALAWVLRLDGVLPIPKASSPAHVDDNHAALDLELTDDDLGVLDRAFPAPVSAQPLEML